MMIDIKNNKNMNIKKVFRNKVKKMIFDNAGTTMIETLVSFTVLVIVFAALIGMVRFSASLRMRALDTARVREEFSDEIYKTGTKNNVEIHEYIGAHSPISGNSDTMFTLKINVDPGKTHYSNLDTNATANSEALRLKFIKSISMPNLDATGIVSKDSRIQEEKLAEPKVLIFEYNKNVTPSSP